MADESAEALEATAEALEATAEAAEATAEAIEDTDSGKGGAAPTAVVVEERTVDPDIHKEIGYLTEQIGQLQARIDAMESVAPVITEAVIEAVEE